MQQNDHTHHTAITMNLPALANIDATITRDIALSFTTATSAPPPFEPVEKRREARPGTLRIAFVITRSDSFGGSSVHIRDFSRVLMEAGHEVTVFIGGEGPVTDAYRDAGIPYVALKHLVREVKPKADLLGLWELRNALRHYNPDLISTHTSKAGFLGRICAWSLRIPSLYTPHCWSFTDGFPGAKVYLWAERIARPFGRRIIMVSEAERQEGIIGRVGSPEQLTTVHNGMPDVAPHLRANPRLSPPRLMMIGRCEPQKDQITLLKALAQLKDLPWTLEAIGEGPLRQKVESTVRELGLSDRVSLLNHLGHRGDVAEHLSQSQIFTLITNWEGLPRSIIEAMRAGLPVVASNVGGNAEAVVDGRSGFIVERGDANGLAVRLRALIADPDLRAKFGAAGRRRYEASFTLDHMVTKTVKVWSEVLGRRVPMHNPSPVLKPRETFARVAQVA